MSSSPTHNDRLESCADGARRLAPTLTELTNEAQALKAAGRTREAIDAFRRIVTLAPGNGAVLHNLAAALGDAGQGAEAVKQAKAALATGLNAPETWLVLARALVAIGELDEAAETFRKVLHLRPADTTAHREFAQLIWMRTGDVGQALAPINAAISAAPNFIDLLLVRAHVLGQCGDTGAEYQEMSEVVAKTGGPPAVEMAAANSALAAGKHQKALLHARNACNATPDDSGALSALCRSLMANGEAQEASGVASRLTHQHPLDQHFIALQATAWRLLRDDRYGELYDYAAFVRTAPLATPGRWSTLDAYLDELTTALDRHHQYRTHPFGQSVRHGSQLPSIDAIDEPALQAFREAASGPIKQYLEAVGIGDDPVRRRNKGRFDIITSWSIRLPSSGFHVDHVHPEGWLSSACHIRLPETLGDDTKAGWLKFGEPGVPTSPKLEAEHFLKPQRGVLAIFPAYMWHGTVPFEAETSRLTVAIDIAPGLA